MYYILPLELELTILELAAPPLAIDSLHDRVDFFINVSLVHRSLAACAQDRLRDQFLYTYCRRRDEHARLKMRFEAGFGRDRPLRRLYLDLTRLPDDIHSRKAPGTASVSATINGRVHEPVSSISGLGGPEHAGTKAQEQACEAVADFVRLENDWENDRWELCTMITSYSQALDTLWLKPPFFDVNIKHFPPPRVLYIYGDLNSVWGNLELLPTSSKTVLVLRSIWLGATDSKLYNPDYYRSDPPVVLPLLEAFTFTWLRPSADLESQVLADAEADALAEMQQVVKSIVTAPQCTFEFLRSTKSPEDALADALAALNLDL